MDRKRGKKPKSLIQQWLEVILLGLLLAFLIKAFVVEGMDIPGNSMEDTIFSGDKVVIERITYRTRPPRQGDLVVFRYPLNPTRHMIKRCIAVEGQSVEIIDKTVYVDGVRVMDPPHIKYIDPTIYDAIYSNRDNLAPFTVPKGHIFVMGDNRDQSIDSRFWGTLDRKYIYGKPLFIYFSWEPGKGPQYHSAVSLVSVLFYNITHFPTLIRWERLGHILK